MFSIKLNTATKTQKSDKKAKAPAKIFTLYGGAAAGKSMKTVSPVGLIAAAYEAWTNPSKKTYDRFLSMRSMTCVVTDPDKMVTIVPKKDKHTFKEPVTLKMGVANVLKTGVWTHFQNMDLKIDGPQFQAVFKRLEQRALVGTVVYERLKEEITRQFIKVGYTLTGEDVTFEKAVVNSKTFTRNYSPSYTLPVEPLTLNATAALLGMAFGGEVRIVKEITPAHMDTACSELVSFVTPQLAANTVNLKSNTSGTPTGLLNRIGKIYSTPCVAPLRMDILAAVREDFLLPTTDPDYQPTVADLFSAMTAMNGKARPGGWLMHLKPEDRVALSDNGRSGLMVENFTQVVLGEALALARITAPESEIGEFAGKLGIRSDNTAHCPEVILAPKSECVPLREVNTAFGTVKDLKTRPYGIYSAGYQLLMKAVGSAFEKHVRPLEQGGISAVGYNYDWGAVAGAGPEWFYQFLLDARKDLAPCEGFPQGKWRLILYGDDTIILTYDYIIQIDVSGADGSLNSSELAETVKILFGGNLHSSYDELVKTFADELMNTLFSIGLRVYRKTSAAGPGNSMISGGPYTTYVDIVALALRFYTYAAMVNPPGYLKRFDSRMFDRGSRSYQAYCTAAQVTLKECRRVAYDELLGFEGLFLSHSFSKVSFEYDGEVKNSIAFSPSEPALIASLVHPGTKAVDNCINAFRALCFAMGFPEHPTLFQVCSVIINSRLDELVAMGPIDDQLVLDGVSDEVRKQAFELLSRMKIEGMPPRDFFMGKKFLGKEPAPKQTVAVVTVPQAEQLVDVFEVGRFKFESDWAMPEAILAPPVKPVVHHVENVEDKKAKFQLKPMSFKPLDDVLPLSSQRTKVVPTILSRPESDEELEVNKDFILSAVSNDMSEGYSSDDADDESEDIYAELVRDVDDFIQIVKTTHSVVVEPQSNDTVTVGNVLYNLREGAKIGIALSQDMVKSVMQQLKSEEWMAAREKIKVAATTFERAIVSRPQFGRINYLAIRNPKHVIMLAKCLGIPLEGLGIGPKTTKRYDTLLKDKDYFLESSVFITGRLPKGMSASERTLIRQIIPAIPEIT